jgi:hypothetical protein
VALERFAMREARILRLVLDDAFVEKRELSTRNWLLPSATDGSDRSRSCVLVCELAELEPAPDDAL